MNVPTIKDLQPQIGGDVAYPHTKASSRYMGTARLNLRRPSRMPASSRKYLHGDPVHLIDWRAYARSDQLIIREQRDEASTRVMICVDLNDTMSWPDMDRPSLPKKSELALRIALHLAFNHLKKGDLVKVAIWPVKEEKPTNILRLSSSSDVLRMFENLKSQQFQLAHESQHLIPYPFTSYSYDQLYLISDMLREQDWKWLFTTSRQLTLVHVLSSLEWHINWLNSEVCYFDEQLAKKEFLGSSLIQGGRYENRMREWSKELKESCQKNQGQYLLVTDKTSLREYLDQLFR